MLSLKECFLCFVSCSLAEFFSAGASDFSASVATVSDLFSSCFADAFGFLCSIPCSSQYSAYSSSIVRNETVGTNVSLLHFSSTFAACADSSGVINEALSMSVLNFSSAAMSFLRLLNTRSSSSGVYVSLSFSVFT